MSCDAGLRFVLVGIGFWFCGCLQGAVAAGCGFMVGFKYSDGAEQHQIGWAGSQLGGCAFGWCEWGYTTLIDRVPFARGLGVGCILRACLGSEASP